MFDVQISDEVYVNRVILATLSELYPRHGFPRSRHCYQDNENKPVQQQGLQRSSWSGCSFYWRIGLRAIILEAYQHARMDPHGHKPHEILALASTTKGPLSTVQLICFQEMFLETCLWSKGYLGGRWIPRIGTAVNCSTSHIPNVFIHRQHVTGWVRMSQQTSWQAEFWLM